MAVLGSRCSHTRVRPVADLGAPTDGLAGSLEPGFGKILLHHVDQEQEAFAAAFGDKVLPQRRSAA